ncbi:TQO small subunit DoxD [Acidihalobacter yilgarnensis]|nr:TQO small subunit DoxD [Acidihalobacter yilgarnensis]
MSDSSPTTRETTAAAADPTMRNIDMWTLLGLTMLGVRLVQGWVYWGGASRRLIYSVGKLDPSSSAYMGHKMNTAIPGAIFGTGDALSALLHHPTLLYGAIIIFTLVELLVGLGLVFGFMTRFFGLISVGLAISLMLMFGWLGSTCVDEWTMASNSFAMGLGIMIAGGGSWWSLDHWVAKKFPRLARHAWFPWIFSGPLPVVVVTRFAKLFGIFAIVFAVGFYSYLRGAVYSPLVARTNPKNHHIALSKPVLSSSGNLSLVAYVDAGPDTQGAYVIQASIVDASGHVVETWGGKVLSELAKTELSNEYSYSLFKPTKYGFVGALGARATISLPHQGLLTLAPGNYRAIFLGIDGKQWKTQVVVGMQ